MLLDSTRVFSSERLNSVESGTTFGTRRIFPIVLRVFVLNELKADPPLPPAIRKDDKSSSCDRVSGDSGL